MTQPKREPFDRTKTIRLTKNYKAIVDFDDYERISKNKWYANMTKGKPYAVSGGWKMPPLRMHREVLGAKPGQYIDHINGNTLDNRKCNLRICTNQQNSWNKNKRMGKKFKGVYRQMNRWRSAICIDGKSIFIGSFSSEEEAAKQYDVKARELFGDFAKLNFPGAGEIK